MKIRIDVILDPHQTNLFSSGERVDAFLQNEVAPIVRREFETTKTAGRVDIGLNIVGTVKTIGMSDIQIVVYYSTMGLPDLWVSLRESIKRQIGVVFNQTRCFERSSPLLTLSVDCLAEQGEGPMTFTHAPIR